MLESTANQPKILRKMVIRFGALSFFLIAAFFGYRYYSEWSRDIDVPEEWDSAGWIGALKTNEEGAQLVAIKPDDTIVECPGYSANKYDKEFEWRPDGKRIFFLSDRVEGETNVFRWNYGAGSAARRTSNSRAKASISFLPSSIPGANKSALLVSGKTVVEFNPVDGATWNVLPPTDKERTTTDETTGSMTQMTYDQIGQSFKSAQWTPDKAFVVAVMRTEDGEALIVQSLGTGAMPLAFAKGRSIEFDVHPETGRVFYSVVDFVPLEMREEFIKDGKLELPFRHMVGWFDPSRVSSKDMPTDAAGIMFGEPSAEIGFKYLSLSPDGARLSFVSTKRNADGVEEADALNLMPATETGAQNGVVVVKGAVLEPSWMPNSKGFVFIMRDEGERSVFTINDDGTGLKNRTKGKGDFAWPKMSPQIK